MTYQLSISPPVPAPARAYKARQVGIVASLLVIAAIYMLAPFLPAWLVAWPREYILPAAKYLSSGLKWISESHIVGDVALKDLTRSLSAVIEWPTKIIQVVLVDGIYKGFGSQQVTIVPPLSWLGLSVAAVLLGWRLAGARLAFLTAFSACYLLGFGLWRSAMQTISLLTIAVPIGAGLGLWLGIMLWRRPKIQTPALLAFDQLQTMPIFAYLVPLIVFFGLGYSPAILATVIFAVPTMIRTTVAGLNLAQNSIGELAHSVGCNRRQELWTILIPTAQAELRVGINQIVMLSFSCTVLASMVGTNGLGYDILVALRQLNIGRGLEAGLGITLMAILLDRFFQSSVKRASGRRIALRNFLIIIGAVLLVPTAASLFVPQLAVFPAEWNVSTGSFADNIVEWTNVNLFWLMDGIKNGLLIHVLIPVKTFMVGIPWIVGVLFVSLLGYLIGGWRRALLVGSLMLAIAAVGLWQVTMLTIYLCSVAVVTASLFGIPLGILAGRSRTAAGIIMPIVDTLQTLPAFVYLIPVIMFFGAGEFPAFVAITAYAICPAIRFTELGIRGVPESLKEAGTQLGMTSLQRLFKIELPTAAPQVLLGLNGTIVMALAMLVVTALIGTKDLGRETLSALAKVDPGQGLTGGLAIACLAVIANRLVGGLAEIRLAAQTPRS
ncbi:proline/glycine betaine ABC transporter permease [Hyphomicrobium sp. 99]|uniref:ABC transporter permease n=1 Tax=Hyphomicrobium sp. 99 TaxID=1163419 RepID=UPI0012E01972|nr:ABC transporter permease subunit [Hyphomicrobium sp. 99]